MLKRTAVLSALLAALLFNTPAMANATTQNANQNSSKEKIPALSELFTNYHLALFYNNELEKDKKYENKAFGECIAKPHAQITKIYQDYFDLPENRESYAELEKVLHQEDQKGMGTAMAIMFQMTLSSMAVSQESTELTDTGKELVRLTSERIIECEKLIN